MLYVGDSWLAKHMTRKSPQPRSNMMWK